ncbi:MAG: sirohydrochlorin cobaltochelatase [Bacteroides sp.]|nr:sirohydrochlorin cobaltochelatase [Bacteroides sp.]
MIKQTFFLILFLFITQLGFANGTHYQKSDFFATMQPGDKAALLMVHFGTTHDDTRELIINAINQKAQAMFPNLDMREAYTSRIIIHRLKQRGVEKLTPLEMLKQLHKDGYTHVIIQSSNIIDGIEMESLRQDVHEVEKDFKEIRIGKPLLYGKEDYEQVIDALMPLLPAQGAIVLVGHGTYTPITAAYTMVDYMLKAKGYTHAHVGTIEGYPAFEDALRMLKAGQEKTVTLVPFMFVAGEHAKNDIAVDWKNDLEAEGYTVNVYAKGLGENPAIQDLFIERIKYATTHKLLPINEKKKEYAKGKDKF